MASPFTWVFELIDRTSGPAKNVATAYEKGEKAARSTAKGHDELEKAAGKVGRAHESLLKQLLEFEGIKWTFEKVKQGWERLMEAMTFKQESLIQLRTLT